MTTLTIDPGARPGFAWDERVTHVAALVPPTAWDEVVVEDQFLAKFIYRGGHRVRVSPKAQISLIRTAERLLMQFPAVKQYRISPMVWRALLWPGCGRVTKPVVLARLRAAEPWLGDATDDAVEARGILLAWRKLTPAQKRKYLVK